MVGMQIKNTHLDGNSTNFQNYPGRALFGIPKVPGGLLDAPGVSGNSQAPRLSPEPAQMGSGRPQSDRVDLGGLRSTCGGAQNVKVDVK